MTREIKFRGKAVEGGRWVYGNLIVMRAYGEHPERNFINNKISGLGNFHDYPLSSYIVAAEVDPKTVGQFTGLDDVNGVDIYEGDIFKVGKTSSFVVYWDTNVGFRFNSYMENGLIGDLYGASKVGNVTGNMSENRQLLEAHHVQ